MKGLLTPLRIEPARIKGKVWNGRLFRLLKNLIYRSKVAGKTISVPAGFITDFATWIKPTGNYIEGSVVHDYLYSIRAGRLLADRVFKEMMERGGCTRARIHMMYYGVRLFGWWAYYISPMLKKERQDAK